MKTFKCKVTWNFGTFDIVFHTRSNEFQLQHFCVKRLFRKINENLIKIERNLRLYPFHKIHHVYEIMNFIAHSTLGI